MSSLWAWPYYWTCLLEGTPFSVTYFQVRLLHLPSGWNILYVFQLSALETICSSIFPIVVSGSASQSSWMLVLSGIQTHFESITLRVSLESTFSLDILVSPWPPHLQEHWHPFLLSVCPYKVYFWDCSIGCVLRKSKWICVSETSKKDTCPAKKTTYCSTTPTKKTFMFWVCHQTVRCVSMLFPKMRPE